MRLLTIIFCLIATVVHSQDYALVIHGGAGMLQPEHLSNEKRQAYKRSLTEALQLGQNLLKEGASSLDVVEQVITFLENDSLFNAGKGSVLTASGQVECDASIMNGDNLQAGAIAGVRHLKNPISGARLVMEQSPHVMLSGAGAEEFAMEYGLTTVPNKYFITTKRKKQFDNSKKGTVGAVALDKYGNIAAGTSTGGMSNKAFGRIGDSPIIGAGTYADNSTCGVSCTGHGEYFIRHAVAHDISAHMRYGKVSLLEAADHVIHETLSPEAGAGGVIALDKQGNIAMSFNTSCMFRGYVNPDELKVAIFKED